MGPHDSGSTTFEYDKRTEDEANEEEEKKAMPNLKLPINFCL